MLPKFMLDAWRHGKYSSGLTERLGFLTKADKVKQPVIWLHCVSVGEVQAARPLFQAIRQRFPEYSVVVSTVTVTGQNLARAVFEGEAAQVFYFPVDWRWAVRRALNIAKPSIVLIMETELWPNFLYECRNRQITTAIVNGRLSMKSFGRYELVRAFISRVVNCLDLAVMQTELDAERVRKLGLEPKRVVVAGNMKFDAGSADPANAVTTELATRFNLASDCSVLLAASTHDPEERVLLEAFAALRRAGRNDLRLVIAPRHPERFATVATLLDQSGFLWARRSAGSTIEDKQADVVLLDSIGELRAVFPLASLVFVGGSLAPIGGHNVLEPAAAGACIVTGPHTHNFEEIIRAFKTREALVQIHPQQNGAMTMMLTKTFDDLLQDTKHRQELGARGKTLVEENRGATLRTIELLMPMLNELSKA